MRPIDADKIMADIASAERSTPKDYTLLSIARYISIQPTIEAEPVRHGKWIPKTVSGGRDSWECSECGRRARGKLENLPYCHCGAKMDLNEVNDEKPL